MNTAKDFAKALLGFACFLALGFLLFVLTCCAAMRGAGEGLKQDAKWLPEPYGTIADVAGTALVIFAGHKTHRHMKRRRERKALGLPK